MTIDHSKTIEALTLEVDKLNKEKANLFAKIDKLHETPKLVYEEYPYQCGFLDCLALVKEALTAQPVPQAAGVDRNKVRKIWKSKAEAAIKSGRVLTADEELDIILDAATLPSEPVLSEQAALGVEDDTLEVIRGIAMDSPELNPSNYTHDQACELNRAMCEICSILNKAALQNAAK